MFNCSHSLFIVFKITIIYENMLNIFILCVHSFVDMTLLLLSQQTVFIFLFLVHLENYFILTYYLS